MSKHTPGPKAEKFKNQVLSDANFRDAAQAAIEMYNTKDLLADALVWQGIIARYEAERTRLLEACRASVEDWADSGISGDGSPLPMPDYVLMARDAIAKAEGK